MARNFSFPILKPQQIVLCINDMNIPFSEAELIKPTPEGMKPLYEQIVQYIYGVTREELAQPVLSAQDTMPYPELHEESVGAVRFQRLLLDLLEGAGVYDFSLRDVFKPTVDRTKRNLSAIINFAKFREEKLATQFELQERSDDLLERKLKLVKQEEKHAKLKAERARVLQERQTQEGDAEVLRQSNKELEDKIKKINRAQKEISEENKALKANGLEIKEKLANTKCLLVNAKKEQEDLKARIVQSPEKTKRKLKSLEADLEHDKQSLVEAEQRARDCQALLDSYGKAYKDVQKGIALLQETEDHIERKKTVSKKVRECRAQLKSSEDEAWDLDAKYNQLQRQLNSAKDKLERLNKTATMRKESADSNVRSARAEQISTQEECRTMSEKIRDLDSQITQTHSQISRLRLDHAQEQAALQAKYDGLIQQVASYHQQLREVM